MLRLTVLAFLLPWCQGWQSLNLDPETEPGEAAPPCQAPPPFWCDDSGLADSCGVLGPCTSYNTTAAGKKIDIVLLYETLCPDCQEFILNVLDPQVWQMAKDIVNLTLVPYGNARRATANGTEQIVCQHGPVECALNRLHSCAIDALQVPDAWFPFIVCMEKELKNHAQPEAAVKKCFKTAGVSDTAQKKIADCQKGPRGDKLQQLMADTTDNVWPQKHFFVPWIVVNGVSTTNMQLYQDVLMNIICAWYRGPNIPQGCQMFETFIFMKKKSKTTW